MKNINKKAKLDYEVIQVFEAGIVLNGSEAKSVQANHVDLTQAFAKIIGNEAFLLNAHIFVPDGNEARRTRKLLLHKKEIATIEAKLAQKKLTLVPLSVYTKGRRVKIELALARSRKEFQKREILKKRDIQRDLDRELKG